MNFIASPLNYTGGKFKLLPQIIKYIPQEIDTFVDIFTGGCNVAVNITAENKICNDLEYHVIELYEYMKAVGKERFIMELDAAILKYNLSKTNKEGFLKCRVDYNSKKNPVLFYALIAHAFNHQIRFNSKGEYNIPFGKDRHEFNAKLRKKLELFLDVLDDSYTFLNLDFRKVPLDKLTKESFVYADPPYLISTATYNESDGWTEKDDLDLFDLLDELNTKGIKFMMSNVIEHKGRTNELLLDWSKKYNVIDLNFHYSNSSYQGKDKCKESTREVIIINY